MKLGVFLSLAKRIAKFSTSDCVTGDTIKIGALHDPYHRVTPDQSLPEKWRIPIAAAVACALVGLALRYLAREHATAD